MIFILGLCVLFDKIAYAEGKIDVFVSIAPQKYFVEKIAQTQVEVSVLVQPGASPATYEPKPKQMIALSKTKIYFAIGVPFERVWLKKIAVANPEHANYKYPEWNHKNSNGNISPARARAS